MNDSREEIDRDIQTVGRIAAVPTLLRVLCDSTGMGFAAVARVTDGTWTACAVQDDIEFGLKSGGQLDVHTTLCKEVRLARKAVVIEQASIDPLYNEHHTPRIYRIESYISVPIILSDGVYLGNLCAIDPRPAKLATPHILSMFNHFAALIAHQFESERKREVADAALLDAQAQGELRDQFIAILGHDLRSPLAAISNGGEVLQYLSTDSDVLNVATSIKRSVKRMSLLINDVLDFARGRLGGGIGVRVEDVDDIGTVLSAVVAELDEAHPGRVIHCDIRFNGKLRCDRHRLQQLASNLLSNALVHGAIDRPVKLTATANDEYFVLEVCNEGEVIPKESIDKIFSPFWRHSTLDNREGLGLGLHICSQIVAAHHGKLQVVSTQESGTIFTVLLPLSDVSNDAVSKLRYHQ